MGAQFVVAVVVEALDGGVLDGAVHPFDLTVGPGMVRLGQPVLYAVGVADHVEAHLTREGGVAVAGLLGELDAVVRQDGVDLVRHGPQQVLQELPGGSPVGLVDQLGDGELAGAVDADKQIELAFGGLHLGDIDVEEADRIPLETLPFGLVAFDIADVPLRISSTRS